VKILVAYATVHGSTKGTAARIAAKLRQCGLDVTLQHADAADAVAGYDAFVIGGAAWMSHWINESARFVRLHWMLLADRPVWLFSTGSAPAAAEPGQTELPTAPCEFAEFAVTIRPRDARVFPRATGLDSESERVRIRLLGLVRAMAGLRGSAMPSDARGLPSVDRWADGIARELVTTAV